MDFGRKKDIRFFSKNIVALVGVVLLKVVEMIVFSRILYHYFNINVNIQEESVDVVVLILIMTPFTFIVMRQKKTMQDAEDKYRILAEHSLIGVYTVQNGIITYANHQFSVMTGYTNEELIGMPVLDLVYEEDRSVVKSLVKRKRMEKEASAIIEFRGIRKDKNIINVEIYGTITFHNGKRQIAGSILDITERKRNENLLIDWAFKDPLTGLPNRRYFEENFNRSLYNLSGTITALMFFDLDGFKAINDSYGHEIGDAMLKEVANRLRSCVRMNDYVSRLGGDEFVILLPSVDHDDVVMAARRIIKDINLPFIINSKNIYISTSIGIDFYPTDGQDFETLLRNADAAMYQAKKNGKNTYFIYNEELLQNH